MKLLQKCNSKKAESTGNFIGNETANKITKSSKSLPQNTSGTVERETEIPKEIYISPEERQQVIDE